MKKSIICLTILLAMVCLLLSCASKRKAHVDFSEPEKMTFTETNLSLVAPSISPYEMGALLESRANAKLTEKMAEQIGSGDTNYGAFCGVIVNDDPSYSIFFAHPERSKKLKIRSNSCKFIYTTNVRNKITVYNTKGDYTIIKVDKKGGVYNGRPYHYGIRVYTTGL